jgi:hypothetical protein
MKLYKVTWKSGRTAGAIGIFYPDSVVVEAENPDAAILEAYKTHEHLLGINVIEKRAC